MSNIKNSLDLCLVQANQVWEDKESNLDHYENLLRDVKDVDLLVLPEMFHTGFSMKSAELSEPMESSAGLAWLHDLARSKKSAVYTSLIVKSKGHYFNRGVFVSPDGLLGFYDKRKSFCLAGEDKHYSAGSKETIAKYLGWNIQLQICYDLRFPEISRNKITTEGRPAYDLLVYVANWPERRRSHWQALLRARAIENQSYVVGVNRVGIDGAGLSYSGDSVCIDPLGEETGCGVGKETVKVISIEYSRLLEIREALPFLKDQ